MFLCFWKEGRGGDKKRDRMRWNPSRTVRRKPGKGGVRAGKRKEQQKGGIRVVFVRHMMRDGNSGGKMQMLVGEYCHPASWKSPETNHRFKTSIQKYFPYPKITVECSQKKIKKSATYKLPPSN